jgi:hypothetical protein
VLDRRKGRLSLCLLGVATSVAILTSSCSVLPPDAPDVPSADCTHVSLRKSSADTTLILHGSGTEWPEISSEASVSVPVDWPDVEKLLMPSSTMEKSAALNCFLKDSNERHASSPDVRLEERNGSGPQTSSCTSE